MKFQFLLISLLGLLSFAFAAPATITSQDIGRVIEAITDLSTGNYLDLAVEIIVAIVEEELKDDSDKNGLKKLLPNEVQSFTSSLGSSSSLTGDEVDKIITLVERLSAQKIEAFIESVVAFLTKESSKTSSPPVVSQIYSDLVNAPKSSMPVTSTSVGSNTTALHKSMATTITSYLSITVTSSVLDSTVTPIVTTSPTTKTVATSSSSTKTSSTAAPTGTSYTGRGTYYQPSADACGTSSSASDHVVAIAQTLYDSVGVDNEAVSSACGKYITASYQGKSVQVKVVDACASCSNVDLDFSPAAFSELAELEVGEIEITWQWS